MENWNHLVPSKYGAEREKPESRKRVQGHDHNAGKQTPRAGEAARRWQAQAAQADGLGIQGPERPWKDGRQRVGMGAWKGLFVEELLLLVMMQGAQGMATWTREGQIPRARGVREAPSNISLRVKWQ